MLRFLQKKTSMILIIAIFLVCIEAFIAIIAADFIQALTLRASAGNTLELSNNIDVAIVKMRETYKGNVIALYDLGTLNVSLIFSSIIIFALIAGSLGVIFSSKASALYVANVRYQTYKKIQTFNFQDIDNFSTASLITRTTTDSELINTSFSFAVRFLPNGFFTLVYGLIKSIIEFPEYAITYAFLLPFMFIFIMIIVWKSVPYFKGIQINTDKVNKSVRESILGIRVVKAYNLESSEKAKFEKENENLTITSEKAFTIIGIMMPVIQVAISATVISVLILGYSRANSVGDPTEFVKITGFVSILMEVLFGFIISFASFMQIARSIPSIKRIIEIINYKSKMIYNTNSTNQITRGEIEFKNVSFSFNENSESSILDNINLKINSKEKIGIIGGTGSGKSTMINLMARLLDPTEGEILIDGVNVKDYSFNQLNSEIAIAMQSVVLFSGTIKSNIAMGLSSNLTDEEIEKESTKAAKAAEAWEFILKKENGINSIVEQRGRNFSGGQKQRISIARTIAKKSKIIIFDDSTSALDTITERKVQSNIKQYNDATTIIVAQRISSVEELDKIIVLDKGKIVGFDNHKNLLLNNETYRSIAASQLGSEEVNKIILEMKGMN